MNTVEKLIEVFRRFPSVGPKQAERFAMYVMRSNPIEINELIEAIVDTKANVKQCKKCFNYTADDICDICSDDKRDRGLLCVIENPFDLIAIEKTKTYNGLYYILGSYLLPHPHKNEFDERVEFLKKRIIDEGIKEVIIALNTTTEGQATSIYIKESISNFVSKISRIAFGVPLGADIDYIDEFTLAYALRGRTSLDK
ncbi:MAG: recombination protein RecR [Elusimicrobiales bacterium]|jgi:recombination protein RecR|nr:recombination protein RecR [Elusimicrobiales bacterium]NLH39457.1 recombination protein RecR [Elusimicrobiota bacterium]